MTIRGLKFEGSGGAGATLPTKDEQIAELREKVAQLAELKKAEPTKKWPFVETPGQFRDRLRDALVKFGDLLPAVRCVLIENPPTFAAPVVQPDFFPDACRLALELECLLLSCNDNAAVSKWWDSAHEALEQHRAMIAAAQGEEK